MKTEIHEQCNVCFEVLDATHPTTITADILDQLQLLITKINIKLLGNSPICDTCLEKVKSACKFKTSYLDLQDTFHHIKLEEDAYSEKPTVCEICKSILSSSDTIPLFDPVTKINKLMLINHLSPELESKVNEDPQTCESCHKSMLNFCNITNLLSVFDQDTVDDSETPSTTIKKERQDVDCSLVSASSSTDISIRLKKEESPSEEDEEKEGKDCNEYEEFMSKNEEVDLKMDCDEEQGDERMEAHSEEAEKVEMFQCEICEYKAKRKVLLKRHMIVHKEPDEVSMTHCEICEFKTRYKQSIKNHMLTHKNLDETEVFQCDICTHKTKYKQSLKMHKLRHKKPDEQFKFRCEICEYTAARKACLKKHMIRHKKPEEVEMFKCDMCEHRTRHKYSLKNHMLSHKKPDEVKTFQCEKCTYKTIHKQHLKSHLLRHKKPDEVEMFKCDICEYRTKYKSSLKNHMLIHKKPDEVETFQCEKCTYKTIYKHHLKSHLLSHNKPVKAEESFRC